MLAPLSWLKKYVDIDIPVDEFIKKMIMSGLAVEGYEEVAPDISGVIVGKILSVEKHTNADSLTICRTDIGGKTLQICTAAPNVFEGALVPVAVSGATLSDGLKIKSTKMRGEVSEGMFCSYQELGMSHDMYPSACEDGILIFEEDYPLGTDVKGIFGLDDVVIDFEILANRPDCQSIIGIAREISAILNIPMKKAYEKAGEGSGSLHERISVTVENEELCPRFCGRMVKNVKIGPSPMWMRSALNAVGIRPINNIVDITNYVMTEYGQPMHAYDMKDIRGGRIIVRNARPGEIMRSLDGKDRILDENMLVIADGEGPTGIAGVMGGEFSEIKAETTEIFFEAASFAFESVRVTARKLGMRTASSSLFEKGVNAAVTGAAMGRALELVQALGCGEVVGGEIDIYNNPENNPQVVSPVDRLKTLMGVDVSTEEMISALERLDIKSRVEGDNIVSVAPPYRNDIQCAADISEEILRMVGYDKIPSTLMEGETVSGSIGETHALEYGLREILMGAGYTEAMTYSFVSPKVFSSILLGESDFRRGGARLLNPLGEDYSVMRTTLVPSMLQTISNNYSRKIPSCRMFEIAPVFLPKQLPLTELVNEEKHLMMAAYGPGEDFFSLKGVCDMLLDQHGIKADYIRVDAACEPYLHPGRSAQIVSGEKVIGIIGQLHPDTCDNYKIGVTVIADLNIEQIKALANYLTEAKAPPRFPAVIRDVALIMDEDQLVGKCMETIAKACGKLLDGVSVFDIYKGKGVPEGKKSVAFSYSLRAPDRTLTEDEITRVFKKVLDSCEKQHGAILRS
ncbi:MAG: phenylalanine--tRNA ligase subunit beta [Christensenellales bacterium]|jgi:phenylalanyl-tRNA synthetase beta chain